MEKVSEPSNLETRTWSSQPVLICFFLLAFIRSFHKLFLLTSGNGRFVWLGFLVHGLEYAFHLLYFLFALSIPGFYLYFNRKYHPAKEPSSIKDKILGWLLGSIFLLIVFGIPAVLWYFFGLPLLLKN